MKTLAISANIRKSVGKSDSKALRNQGMVPCVLYGGEKQVCFYAETNAFRNLVYTPEVYFVELNIDNNKYKAIMQDIQFHPVTDKILHIDFLEIFDDKEVTISIPVTLKGLAIGVRNGGNLLHRRKKIITRGLPSNLPDAIEVNIEDLNIGDFIYIKDLTSDNYTFLAPDSSVVVGVKTARGAIEDEVEEGNEEESASDTSPDVASESENKTGKESAKEESSEKQE